MAENGVSECSGGRAHEDEVNFGALVDGVEDEGDVERVHEPVIKA